QRVALLLTALAQGEAGLVRVAMEDRLHQPYREQLMGPFRAVVQAARAAGADGVALSGAGPAVLAVTCRQEEEIGEAMCKPFLECGIACRSLILRVSAQGVHRVDTQ
ncbi:MAG: homoserine kinase, partial [Nitrospinota bacterium]